MRTSASTTRWPLLWPSATIVLALTSFSLLSLGHSHSVRHHHNPRSLNASSNPNFRGYNLRTTAVTKIASQTSGSSASSDSGDFTSGVVMVRHTAEMAASQTAMPKLRVARTLPQQIKHVLSTCVAQSLVSAARRPISARNSAAVKSKNPNLKVLIALGGWTFSDLGAWQDVFPTMASTAENRATFIKNALGWLSEYGYDGIDFDWEYLGADNRRGSDGDGVNYTALLKELCAAIDASGKELGLKGECTKSAGILSYREITDILEKTGAKLYFDKEAAAKYIVYEGDNWISYNDADLTALRAITDPNLANGDSAPFTLIDLYNLFSNEDYPTDDTDPRFGIVNFSSEANMGKTGPNKTGFGFFLVVGELHAVSKLRRQAGDLEPFTFLDCPVNVTGRPNERSVEGTVVEMSNNYVPSTFT
ncbi:hypothetical protein V502_02265 [Pseudogymnoascus sp. VKM F-4520 (FW-2644)]|nr:hypothetical protein V502_02265 [Pseudogymnoascus sp. VKM F-4520 (FW-2644)]